jgi:hypothetical protein
LFEALEDRRLLAVELGLDDPASAASPKTLPELPAAAQYVISAAIGNDQETYHASTDAAGWALANRTQGFTAHVQSGDLLVSSGADHWQMSLAGFGYGGTVQSVGAAQCSASNNRVACDYGAIEEWYVNGPGGLQQGFTVDPPPDPAVVAGLLTEPAVVAGLLTEPAVVAGLLTEPAVVAGLLTEPPDRRSLTVELAMAGDLRATVNAAGDGLTLARPDGTTALSYSGLVAFDATGRTLPASLEVRPDGAGQDLLIHVDAAGAQGAITIDPFIQQAKLTSSDGGGLGRVAIDGDTVVAIGDAGYVFVKPSSGWADMTQVARLTSTDGTEARGFGSSVAISGDTVVIGAPLANINGITGLGAAYVYVKPASGWADMTQTARLIASDQTSITRLGYSVAIDGDTVVAGANAATVGANDYQGAAYVFVKPTSGWADMTHTAKLVASDGRRMEMLGFSVGISGDTVVSGARYATVNGQTNQGAAYVFVKPAAGWADATETAKLTASDGGANNWFGLPVAIDGTTVVAGSAGVAAAYVFVQPERGWTTTTETAKLTASDGAIGLIPGGWLTIAGDTVLAGGPTAAAYLFAKPASGWVSMTETAKLTNSDLAPASFVALDGDNPVVGTGTAVYVFGPYVGPQPDLTVTATAPSSGAWDETIPVSWTVTNSGAAPASGSWFDAGHLSDTPTFDAQTAVPLGNFPESTHAPLAVADSYTDNQTVTLPGPTALGDRWLLFVTDAAGQVAESGETNNVAAKPIRVTAPDLAVTSVTPAPADVSLGQPLTVTWTVQNQGTAAAGQAWSDDIYLSSRSTLDGSAVWLRSVTAGPDSPLAAGGTYTHAVEVTLPLNLSPGTYYLLAKADADNSVKEANETIRPPAKNRGTAAWASCRPTIPRALARVS